MTKNKRFTDKQIKLFTKSFFLAVILMFYGVFISQAAELQKFSNVRLVNNPANDGDSFLIDARERLIHVRLYFVDCPETSIRFKSDARRVREQTRYFGLTSAENTIRFGYEAKAFVKRILDKPFTIYTAFANAKGRSPKGRVYAFIITSEGNDLASLLVENGFARTRGIGRKTPDGIHRNEMIEMLRDMEISAIMKRAGIWSESDPDKIEELRAEQRREDQELKELQNQVKKAKLSNGSININSASKEELMSINGIGPVLAGRIIAGRPYKTIEDLIKVKGIGQIKLENISPYVEVGEK